MVLHLELITQVTQTFLRSKSAQTGRDQWAVLHATACSEATSLEPASSHAVVCTHGGAVLFAHGQPTRVLDPFPELPLLVTNTNVPGRSTLEMVARVRALHDGPLGDSIAKPVIGALGGV